MKVSPTLRVMSVEDDEILEVKRWLRGLRGDMTQRELAEAMGVTTRVVINAEDVTNPALPRGLPFLRMLRELGVVVAAPAASPSISDRLGSVEAQVETQTQATTKSLAALAKEVRALARRLDGRDGRATRAA